MMQENEFLFSRRLFFRNAKYIVVIKPETAESGGSGSWEGKLNQLKHFLMDSAQQHVEKLEILDKTVDKIFTNALEEKHRNLEDKLNSKMSSVEQRLDIVLRKMIKSSGGNYDELIKG